MSQENVDRFLKGAQAFNRNDIEAGLFESRGKPGAREIWRPAGTWASCLERGDHRLCAGACSRQSGCSRARIAASWSGSAA